MSTTEPNQDAAVTDAAGTTDESTSNGPASAATDPPLTFADLGIDGIWINPWYPSPLLDGGYDVADYRDIHPSFGTLEDADALIEEAHELGIRILVDLVPNHCSWDHIWFKAALQAAPGSPERARFHFTQGSVADDGTGNACTAGGCHGHGGSL